MNLFEKIQQWDSPNILDTDLFKSIAESVKKWQEEEKAQYYLFDIQHLDIEDADKVKSELAKTHKTLYRVSRYMGIYVYSFCVTRN